MSGKRRSRRMAHGGLSENQILHLLNGHCWDSMEGCQPGFPFRDEQHQRECWRKHRDLLIGKDLDEATGRLVEREPGTRPAGFWAYDAPEPLRILKNAEWWKVEAGHESEWRCYWGMHPATHPAEGWSEAGYPLAEYETEADYLERLGLWLPGERERWQAMQREN